VLDNGSILRPWLESASVKAKESLTDDDCSGVSLAGVLRSIASKVASCEVGLDNLVVDVDGAILNKAFNFAAGSSSSETCRGGGFDKDEVA